MSAFRKCLTKHAFKKLSFKCIYFEAFSFRNSGLNAVTNKVDLSKAFKHVLFTTKWLFAGGRVNKMLIRAFSDVEKPFLLSDLAALTAKSENKNGFSTSEKVRIIWLK